MEVKILVTGPGINWEVIGESLFDCLETAYRQFRGQRVQLYSLIPLGYIDGQELSVDDRYFARSSLKEIIAAAS